jgi:hypothetical protein
LAVTADVVLNAASFPFLIASILSFWRLSLASLSAAALCYASLFKRSLFALCLAAFALFHVALLGASRSSNLEAPRESESDRPPSGVAFIP